MNTESEKRNKLISIILRHSAQYGKMNEKQLDLMESQLHTYPTSKLRKLRKKCNASFFKLVNRKK